MNFKQLYINIIFRMEKGNLLKRQQPDTREENSTRPLCIQNKTTLTHSHNTTGKQ